MKTRIEKVGDAFALLLPKEMVEACGFGGEVSVTMQDKTLVVAGADTSARAAWKQAIRNISQEAIDRH